MIVTVAERKAQAIARLKTAFASTRAALAAYAAERRGRFVIFGSFARDDIRPGSDIDLIVDFPTDKERSARDAAEAICRENGLVPDVHLRSEASDALMRRVARDGIVLS